MPDQLEFEFDRRELDFPLDPAARGYAGFTSEQEEALRELEERFGVILNKSVRLRIVGDDTEYKGRLTMDQLLPPSDRKEGVRLRIGGASFDYRDIEFCSILEERL